MNANGPEEWVDDVLERAAEIADAEGHPETISGDDVQAAFEEQNP